MRKSMWAFFLSVSIVAFVSGCGSAVKTIKDRTVSERTNVFIEVSGREAAPAGYVDVLLSSEIKTHVEGYYIGEFEDTAHGKAFYPFVFNIDGQAVVWKAEGKMHILPKYDAEGKTVTDPEAGEGMKYFLNKKIRLRAGSYTLFFGLPLEHYYREVVITLKDGETYLMDFKPVYKYKTRPIRIPTYMKGVNHFEIFINGNRKAS